MRKQGRWAQNLAITSPEMLCQKEEKNDIKENVSKKRVGKTATATMKHSAHPMESMSPFPHEPCTGRAGTTIPTWLESEMQLLLLLICAGGGLTEMTAMCWRGGKVGDGWIRGGVCPKAELRPLCWVRICWYVTGLMGWGKLNAGLQE